MRTTSEQRRVGFGVWSTRRLASTVAAASLAAGGLGVALAGTAEAVPDDCGAHVTKGKWVQPPNSVYTGRDWTWTYYNCGKTTLKKKVVVDWGPDSKCYTIKPKHSATFRMSETLFPHINAFGHTANC